MKVGKHLRELIPLQNRGRDEYKGDSFMFCFVLGALGSLLVPDSGFIPRWLKDHIECPAEQRSAACKACDLLIVSYCNLYLTYSGERRNSKK